MRAAGNSTDRYALLLALATNQLTDGRTEEEQPTDGPIRPIEGRERAVEEWTRVKAGERASETRRNARGRRLRCVTHRCWCWPRALRVSECMAVAPSNGKERLTFLNTI